MKIQRKVRRRARLSVRERVPNVVIGVLFAAWRLRSTEVVQSVLSICRRRRNNADLRSGVNKEAEARVPVCDIEEVVVSSWIIFNLCSHSISVEGRPGTR